MRLFSQISSVVLVLVALASVTQAARRLPSWSSTDGVTLPRRILAGAPAPIERRGLLSRIGTVLGYASIAVGLTPSIPQMFEIIRRRSGEAISMDTLVLRGTADLVSLAGSILCKEELYNIGLNIWYIIDTSIFTAVSVYFTVLYHKKALDASSTAVSKKTWTLATFMLAVPMLMFFYGTVFSDRITSKQMQNSIGIFCLWASNLLFISGRFPQLLKIWKNRSVEGISIFMYLLTMASNLLAGSGVLLPDIENHVPMQQMLGSETAIFLGTYGAVLLDCVFLYMYSIFHKSEEYAVPKDDLNSYVLMEDEDDLVEEVPEPEDDDIFCDAESDPLPSIFDEQD